MRPELYTISRDGTGPSGSARPSESCGGPLECWLVTLTDGLMVDVWAYSVEGTARPEDQRDYRFCNLMDVPPAMQAEFEVVSWTPANPGRAILTVARLPRSSVL